MAVNLCTVGKLSSTSANTNAIVEENGALKRVSLNKLNATADYVVEQGTSGIWTYRKWNSGIAECWGKSSGTFNITTTWGSLYISSGQYAYANYPFTFIETPTCFESHIAEGSSIIGMNSGILGTKTHTPYYQFFRPNSLSNIEITTYWYAIGKWK